MECRLLFSIFLLCLDSKTSWLDQVRVLTGEGRFSSQNFLSLGQWVEIPLNPATISLVGGTFTGNLQITQEVSNARLKVYKNLRSAVTSMFNVDSKKLLKTSNLYSM